MATKYRMKLTQPQRFDAKHTNPLLGCHVWTAANNGRYGTFWNGERLELAHRYAWRLRRGPIPPGMEVDHRCRNTLCVRAGHLRLVTPLKNKHLTRRETCGRGHSGRWGTDYRGWRFCKQCHAENEAKRRARGNPT